MGGNFIGEYIEKAKLYEVIAGLEETARNRFFEVPINRHMDQLCERTRMKHLVADFPTVDVEPVIHAKWVKKEIGINEFLCSNCGRMEVSKTTNDNWNEELRCYSPPDTKYCCDCGAKMDL